MATVFSVAQETTVAAGPTALAVEKVDGVEIFSSGVELDRQPALGIC